MLNDLSQEEAVEVKTSRTIYGEWETDEDDQIRGSRLNDYN